MITELPADKKYDKCFKIINKKYSKQYKLSIDNDLKIQTNKRKLKRQPRKRLIPAYDK